MKRAVVLISIAALLVCIIPMTDSSNAAPGETTISGYIKGGDVSSSTNILIGVIYSDDCSEGKMVGSTKTINPPDNTGHNRFSVTITPEANLNKDHYFLYISILGFKVTRAAEDDYEDHMYDIRVTDPVSGVETVYNSCYQLSGDPIKVNEDNLLGSSTHCFEVESTRGTITGKVVLNTKEPVYLTGVLVSLINKETKAVVATDKTKDDGFEIEYYSGTYDLLFELSGYESVTNEVTITEAGVKMPDIVMKENQSYFGLDLAHAMMILGGAAAVILLLFTMFVRIRLAKK